MFAYLVAGLIVGGLVWYLRHERDDPPVGVQLAVGVIASGIGGLALNLLLGLDFLAVDVWGFTASVLVALVALAFVQARFGGSPQDAPAREDS